MANNPALVAWRDAQRQLCAAERQLAELTESTARPRGGDRQRLLAAVAADVQRQRLLVSELFRIAALESARTRRRPRREASSQPTPAAPAPP